MTRIVFVSSTFVHWNCGDTTIDKNASIPGITTKFDAENRLCPTPAWGFKFDLILLVYFISPQTVEDSEPLPVHMEHLKRRRGAMRKVFDTKSLVHVEGSNYDCSPERYFPIFLFSFLFMCKIFRCKMPCFVRSLHETLKTIQIRQCAQSYPNRKQECMSSLKARTFRATSRLKPIFQTCESKLARSFCQIYWTIMCSIFFQMEL